MQIIVIVLEDIPVSSFLSALLLLQGEESSIKICMNQDYRNHTQVQARCSLIHACLFVLFVYSLAGSLSTFKAL